MGSKFSFLVGLSAGFLIYFVIEQLNNHNSDLKYPIPATEIATVEINHNMSNWDHAVKLTEATQKARQATLKAVCRDTFKKKQCPSKRDQHVHSKSLYSKTYQVITVRDPFSRLVSAYYGKMVKASPGFTWYFAKMSRRICKIYKPLRHNLVDRHRRDSTASFEDFVNYLLNKNSPMDMHWQLFNETCQPCLSNFDFIVKFETLYNDITYLKKRIGISKEHGSVLFSRKPYRVNSDLVRKTFQQITKTKANQLYQIYKNDFQLFGYKKPAWLC